MRRAAVSKYRAVRTEVDGITFASKKEAARYGELKLLEKAGEINGLCCQVSIPLVVNDVQVCRYVCDFMYHPVVDGKIQGWVVEDVKGVRTPLYAWKKRHVEAQYGITITEV